MGSSFGCLFTAERIIIWAILPGGGCCEEGGRITAGGSLSCLLCFLVVGHWFGTVLGLFVLSGCLLTCRVLKNILFIEKTINNIPLMCTIAVVEVDIKNTPSATS